MTNQEYLLLLDELQKLEEKGMALNIDGYPASSVDVVHAHMVRENSTYMRDYIPDNHGVYTELGFNKVYL